MCELSIFAIFLENVLSKFHKILGLIFFKTREDFEGFKRRFSIYVSSFFCLMECLQILSVYSRRRGSFVNTAFPNLKMFAQKSKFFLCPSKLKANVCGNSTFQVNRTKNTTQKRRLTSNNGAAMSASCGERHKKPFSP